MMRSRLGFVPNRLMLALVPRLGLPSELGMAKETSPVYLIQHFKVDNSTAECQSPIVPKIDCPSIDALEFSPPDYLTVKKKARKQSGMRDLWEDRYLERINAGKCFCLCSAMNNVRRPGPA